MRLLLDEMYPASIAEQLRRRGHDVEAVTARPELRALSDPEVFAAAQQEGRAVVTENVVDFAAIADGVDQRGDAHYGVVFVASDKYQRGHSRTVGRMVRALDRLLRVHKSHEATSLRHWL